MRVKTGVQKKEGLTCLCSLSVGVIGVRDRGTNYGQNDPGRVLCVFRVYNSKRPQNF